MLYPEYPSDSFTHVYGTDICFLMCGYIWAVTGTGYRMLMQRVISSVILC